MFQHRIIRYALSAQTKILMHDQHRPYPIEVLFEDQVTLSDGQSKPYPVLLQLTTETLIIRRLKSSINNQNFETTNLRNVTIERQPITRLLGFSIKGGSDTGFPVLISRVVHTNAHLLHIGDAILSINNENISNLTHDQVIAKLQDTAGNQVHLTIKHMNEMARYLHLASPKLRSSLSKTSSSKIQRVQNRVSAEYPSECHHNIKQHRFSLTLSDEQKNDDASTIDYVTIQEYSLLYAYVSQYLNGTDKLRMNSFQLHTLNSSQTGIIITNTSIQQHRWISRINMVIRNLTTRTLAELNQKLLSNEQVFYASWVHERVINRNQNRLPEWKGLVIVFKGSGLYIFDDNKQPPLCSYDFICCTRVYPIVEIFIKTVSLKSSIDDRQYCFTLTLLNDVTTQCRYLHFERTTEYDDFISNYQRALYISVYALQTRSVGCIYQGQICRLLIDINKGFELYNNETNVILWAFTFEELKSSSDNGRDKIYFQFKRYSRVNENEPTIHIEVQCQHLRLLIHVINAFLIVKFLGKRDDTIDYK